MKNLILKTMGLLAIIFIIACSKEGVQGPKGDTGANGTAGTNGTNGTNGNANVIYSDWNNCTLSNEFSSDGYYFKRYSFSGDQNSTDSTSAILKYMRIFFSSGTITTGYQIPFEYNSLRYTSWYTGEFIARMPRATSDVGILRYQMRTVLIKGSTHLRLAKPITQMSYDEVCQMFNIPK